MIQKLPKRAQAISPETAEKRVSANRARRLEELEWERAHAGEVFDREWYLREVLPGLGAISLTAIARGAGISTSAASKIRSGARIPHPRLWSALQELRAGFF
jgi:hypothetical protein